MAEFTHLSNPDPEWQKVAAASPPPPHNLSDPIQIIAAVRKASEDWGPINKATYEPQLPNDFQYRVEDHTVAVDNGVIRLRAVIPVSEGNALPVLVYFHDGAFYTGDIDMKDFMLRVFACKLNAVTVNVEYRTEPSPLPQNDCLAALKWIATNANKLGAYLKNGFVVMGSSAGGHLTAVVAQRALDDALFREYPLTGKILQVPLLCHPGHYPEKYRNRLLSLEQNKDAPMLTKEALFRVYDFLGDNPTDPMISPLFAPSFAGLPRTLIQITGMDPLRDEALCYADQLRDAGVETRIQVYAGVPHGFEMVPGMESTRVAKKLDQDALDAFKWMTTAVSSETD